MLEQQLPAPRILNYRECIPNRQCFHFVSEYRQKVLRCASRLLHTTRKLFITLPKARNNVMMLKALHGGKASIGLKRYSD